MCNMCNEELLDRIANLELKLEEYYCANNDLQADCKRLEEEVQVWEEKWRKKEDERCELANEQLTISVVVESAFIELFDKAAYIQHWHNTGKNDRGMVVSSEKVYELWEALEKYRDLRHSL